MPNKPPFNLSGEKGSGVVWLVNQFVPPDLAPTSRLLGDLSKGLEQRGWRTRFLGVGASYRQGSLGGMRRWARDFWAHVRLLFGGLFAARPDVILCLTDPPVLVFTMRWLAFLRGAKLVHWPMDIYPQIAVALGALRKESFLYRGLSRAASSAISNCTAVVPLDDDMKRVLSPSASQTSLAPWVPEGIVIPENPPLPLSSRVRWIYSGNLGRAHDFETVLRTQKILEEANAPFDLVFQGAGALRSAAQQLATELGLKHCNWLGYARDDALVTSLLSAHVLIATQRLETKGLLWPSKLALLQTLPRPIVWVGATDGAIATLLRLRGELTGIFAPGAWDALADWLMDHAEEIKTAAQEPVSVAAIHQQLDLQRNRSLATWHRILTDVVSTSR